MGLLHILITILFIYIASCTSIEKPTEPIDTPINQKEFSYLLYDLDTQEIVVSYNEDTILTPASIFKLLTAYAALEVLGYDKKFQTKIYYSGEIKNGLLNGNLIISGGGDPSLGYEDLFNIASLIRKKGITEISGQLIYTDDLLISIPEINKNQPIATYNPGLSALTLRNSSFFVNNNFEHQKTSLIPKINYMNFQTIPEMNAPKYIQKHSWIIPEQTQYQLPIKDPSFFASNILKNILEYHNIEITNDNITQEQQDNISNTKLLLKYSSNSLIKIIRYNLNFSNNLTSEILLLQFANAIKCKYSNLETAANCLQNWYSTKFPELEWNNLKWQNGSGLSTNTNITVLHTLEILKKLYSTGYGINSGVSLLPISGLSGTLKHKFLETPLHIWAKTGNMYFISTLAGYIFNKEHRYAFIILANDQNMRNELDNLDQHQQKEHYNYLIQYSKLWKNKIYKKQKELIQTWLNN